MDRQLAVLRFDQAFKRIFSMLLVFFGRCQLSFFSVKKKGFLLFRVNDSMAHSAKAEKENDKKSLNGNLIKIKIRKG